MSNIPTGSEYMSSRRQSILDAMDRLERAERVGDDALADEVREEMDPLSVELVRHVEITLGYGGPTDWLDAELYKDGGVRSVTYHYAWGSESYSRTLSESDALYQYAERMAEYAQQ